MAQQCVLPSGSLSPYQLPSDSPLSVCRYGHGGEDQADETEDEQVQAGSWLRLQAGAGLPQGKSMHGYMMDAWFTTPAKKKKNTHAPTDYCLHDCTVRRPYGTL